MRIVTRLSALLILPALIFCQNQPPHQLTSTEREQIQTKTTELARMVGRLRAKRADATLVADVDVYRKAAEWILRYPEEFFNKSYVANTLAALDRGIARAKDLEGDQPSWPRQKGRLVRAYISRVDGSVQPYGLIIPDSYVGKPVRLDVVLHGRGATLNEVSFIAGHDSPKPAPTGQDFIQLEVFGRTNNAYRWSGETDVFEALKSVQSRYSIDKSRVVLRGFSMGGAGAWHIGLHFPDRWAAIEAGAGFTETKRYAKQSAPPPYQESTFHIYDGVDYALNAFNVPTVGYGGEDDAQLQASANIREQLAREGFTFAKGQFRWTTQDLAALFLIGPKTGHSFHRDSKAESDAFIARALEAPRSDPQRIRFVTYTTAYERCFRFSVEALEHHYERTEVDADASKVTTRNVARLRIERPGEVTLDGQSLLVPQGGAAFERSGGKWKREDKTANGLRKIHGLQGPIDDAFKDSFLCVRPTGRAANEAAGDYARRTFDRFSADFAKWLRGDVRVKDDRDVTDGDIASHHLILFGDPSSNKLLARMLGKLPIKWTKSEVEMRGQRFPAAGHVAAMIYPNPLNPRRYVVINTGHTFGEPEFRGTNALLFPRLGDYAVIDAATGKPALAGLFDDHWK